MPNVRNAFSRLTHRFSILTAVPHANSGCVLDRRRDSRRGATQTDLADTRAPPAR